MLKIYLLIYVRIVDIIEKLEIDDGLELYVINVIIMEIFWRRNNKYKKEYEEYLKLKKWIPYKYNRFYCLRQDYSFEEVLNMLHRKEWWNLNWRIWYNKYTKQYIWIIIWAFEAWNKKKEIADSFNISLNQVKYILQYKKR